ncbi:family 10 glycosylhydrolase [Rufibacter roseus]|uniref:Family 10 glycosylhydrolase n=1 Tax=Rufibacter roseus TaxID=1567108 RepID=A0ABW2DHY0_9BACT|nr:family 10 glycosylhydrolase [Rufibacter roseus]
MKKHTALLALILLLLPFLEVNAQELRGIWLARSSFTSKAKIASQMDSLAAANFNVVYVNVWSRGYPLWQSNVFKQHTGVAIDPTYSGRDILAEAIAEGHRVGLHVEAWFEYGFVAGYAPGGTTSKGPIFEAHPDWVARTQEGVEKDGSNFYWMVQSHPDVQDFLIDLALEIVKNYDVDGIEMDRIRYSSKAYGYDPYTVNLYKSEHNGADPPADGADANWMRWRADKINLFVAKLYDAIKAENPKVNVSSAPSQMGSSTYTAYENLLQDWKWWISNNKVDNLQMQSYSSNINTYQNWNNYTKNSISNYERIYPSFAVNPGSTNLTPQEVIDYYNVTIAQGFNGAAMWFYDDLVGKFHYLRQNRFTTAMHPPYASADWREHKSITTHENSADVVKTGSWATSSSDGYQGKSIYGGVNGAAAAIEYFFNVPANAYYEVYVYNIAASNRTANATYQVIDHAGLSTEKTLDQTNARLAGWNKLGDFYLTQGRHKVIRLTNENVEAGKYISADAIMIIRNRRLDSSSPLGAGNLIEGQEEGMNIFPNPSGRSFKITFSTNSKKVENISLVELNGRAVSISSSAFNAQTQVLSLASSNLKPGVYILLVRREGVVYKRRVIIQ